MKMSALIDVSPNQDAGCLKRIIKEGIGEEKPVEGNSVRVHYVGTFPENGAVFDSSRDRREPFIFNLAKGEVIKGWDIGVATMKKGEIAIFTLSPDYGYGKHGCPPKIKQNATLNFEIELIDWKGECIGPDDDEENDAIVRYVIEKGQEHLTPDEDSTVEVEYVGKYNDTIFDERKLTFMLGFGAEHNLPEGFEYALRKFNQNEKSRIVLRSDYGFGINGCSTFNVPPNAVVEYTIKLLSFTKSKSIWELSKKESHERALVYKDKATHFFKLGRIDVATRLYKNGLEYLSLYASSDDEEDNAYLPKIRELNMIISSNLALCSLKTKNYVEAKKYAHEALQVDERNVKALFRRGQALFHLDESELAKSDFMTVLKFEPNNEAAKQQLAACSKKIEQQRQREKSLYSNIFAKMAESHDKDDKDGEDSEVMSKLGYWGEHDRIRAPSEFEKENPDILVLNRDEFENM